jgi:hypothetical protein
MGDFNWTKMTMGILLEKRRHKVVCLSSVICSWWRQNTGTQQRVQLATELQEWYVNRGDGCPRAVLQHPVKNISMKPSGSSQGEVGDVT